MISRPLVRYILTAAMRDKLLLTLLLMIATGAGLAVFLGSSAITEKDGFALVFGASGLRFLGVMGIVLFCCFYVRRSFETKEVEFLLSRPISRMTFVFSHALAFMLLSALIACGIAAAVFFLGKPSLSGLAAWGLSIAVEGMIMANVAFFFSMVLSSAAGSALAALGFYVLSRLIGTLIGIASAAPENVIYAILNNVMDFISIIVPRLDIMGQSGWLVYGVDGSGGIGYLAQAGHYTQVMMTHLGILGFIGVQGVAFVALVLAATAFDFLRREF